MKNPQACLWLNPSDNNQTSPTCRHDTTKLKEYLTIIIMDIGSVDYCLRTSKIPYPHQDPDDYLTDAIVSVHYAHIASTDRLAIRLCEGIALVKDMIAFAQSRSITLPCWIPFGRQHKNNDIEAGDNTGSFHQTDPSSNKQLLQRSIWSIALVHDKARRLGRNDDKIANIMSEGLFYLYNPFTSGAQMNAILYKTLYNLSLAKRLFDNEPEEWINSYNHPAQRQLQNNIKTGSIN